MKQIIVFFLGLLSISNLLAQSAAYDVSIRKNYREMTATEKQIYLAATIALRTSNVMASYAQLHNANFTMGMHGSEDFTVWHRWYLYLFELEMKASGVAGASKITLPYWDWTSEYYNTAADRKDYQRNTPMFDTDFLGNATITSWGLNRNSSTNELLASNRIQLKNFCLLKTNYGDNNNRPGNFAQSLESTLHDPGHGWVGVTMGSRTSPNDPVFYLHHNNVDKLWQDWENLSGTTTVMTDNTMAGFPGSAPNIAPSLIFDGSRSAYTKTWFAENGKLILDNYTSTNTENYRYTGLIEAGNRAVGSVNMLSTDGVTYIRNYETGKFTVPSGTNVSFMSAKSVVMLPGFSASAGSKFSAYINSNYFNSATASARTGETNEEQVYTSPSGLAEPFNSEMLVLFPNPSNGAVQLLLLNNGDYIYTYKVLDNIGSTILEGSSDSRLDGRQLGLDLAESPKGIYHVKVSINGTIVTKKLIIQ